MRTIKGAILGIYGSGKTSLLRTLDMDKTLFINMEAGDLAVQEFPEENNKKMRDFPMLRAVTSIVCGGDPKLNGVTDSRGYPVPYSQEYADAMSKRFPDIDVAKYDNVFVDSISIASKLCFAWASQQPDAFNKQGNIDTRGIYGMVGREMSAWLWQWQHCNKNVWVVGQLSENKDDDGNITREGMAEGKKTMQELPFIFDIIMTLSNDIKYKDGDKIKSRHGLICKQPNPMNTPAKDRSGVLSMVEPPHLGNLMQKILTSPQSTYNVDMAEFLNDEIIW